MTKLQSFSQIMKNKYPNICSATDSHKRYLLHTHLAALYARRLHSPIHASCIELCSLSAETGGSNTPPVRYILCRRIGSLSSSATFVATRARTASCVGFRADVKSSNGDSGCFQKSASCILCRDGEGVFAIRQPGRNDECELRRVVNRQHIKVDRCGLFFTVGDSDSDGRIRACNFQHTTVDGERTTCSGGSR